jgi:hypothetical protein
VRMSGALVVLGVLGPLFTQLGGPDRQGHRADALLQSKGAVAK